MISGLFYALFYLLYVRVLFGLCSVLYYPFANKFTGSPQRLSIKNYLVKTNVFPLLKLASKP